MWEIKALESNRYTETFNVQVPQDRLMDGNIFYFCNSSLNSKEMEASVPFLFTVRKHLTRGILPLWIWETMGRAVILCFLMLNLKYSKVSNTKPYKRLEDSYLSTDYGARLYNISFQFRQGHIWSTTVSPLWALSRAKRSCRECTAKPLLKTPRQENHLW